MLSVTVQDKTLLGIVIIALAVILCLGRLFPNRAYVIHGAGNRHFYRFTKKWRWRASQAGILIVIHYLGREGGRDEASIENAVLKKKCK